MDWQRMLDGFKKHESILLVCVDVDKMMVQINVKQMASTLSEDELVRAKKFRDPLLSDRFVAGRFCLREILGRELDMASSEISFSIGNNGKPVVSNSPTSPNKGGHFSFSRSQQYALIGYSASRRIGVDVELARSFPDMELMAAEIFAEHQLLKWRSLSPAQRPLGFFRAWTRKEAVVKVDGRGISSGSSDRSSTPGLHEPRTKQRHHRVVDSMATQRRTGSLRGSGMGT